MSLGASLSVSLPPEQEDLIRGLEQRIEILNERIDGGLRLSNWCRVGGAASYLCVSESTIHKWAAEGWLRFNKVDGVVLFNYTWLDEDVTRKGFVPATNHAIAPAATARKTAGRRRT